MKPTFALDLSRDQIALLHRTPKGWLSIGEVAFDAPDMDAAIAVLRSTAIGLSPLGMFTKIILPASQVLYTEVHAPGPSRDDKRRQIAAALEGRTPYAVEDLVFDWSGKGATVKVAVVARETLDEAEGFAVAQRLNPISTVAIPEDGAFVGEPWFGPTAAAATFLSEGEAVDRDRDAVVLLIRDQPSSPVDGGVAPTSVLPSVATNARLEAEPSQDPDAALATSADDALPGLEEALNGDFGELLDAPVTDTPTGPAADDLDAIDDQKTPSDQSFAAVFAAGAPDIPGADTPVLSPDGDLLEDSLSAALADVPDADIAVPLARTDAPPPQQDRPVADPEEAPFAHVTDTSAFPDSDDDGPASVVTEPMINGPARRETAGQDDASASPLSVAMLAFASRRAAGGGGTAPPVDAPARPSGGPPLGSSKLAAPPPSGLASRISSGKGFAGLVTAPSIPGTRAKPKLKPSAAGAGRSSGPQAASAQSPARPGGTFGTSTPPRNRTGVVFMVLVALLLLCLAMIAAWATLYLARNTGDAARQTEVAAVSETVIEFVPGVDDEMLADMQDPAGLTDPLPEASGMPLAQGNAGALATESTDLTLLDDASTPMTLAPAETGLRDGDPAQGNDTAVENGAEAPLPLEPAPATVVKTDLSVAALPADDQDEIFLSAMDAPPPTMDAMALPVPDFVADSAPDAPMPPPAFGTVYKFDARGLLLPTPEGILSPDGVMLIAGPPPLVPPARSEVAAAAAAARALEVTPVAGVPSGVGSTAADASLVTGGAGTVAPVVDPAIATDVAPDLAPVAADPAMAGFRPRARPEGLAPAPAPEDDARLTPDGETAVATLRPLSRPTTVLAAAAALRPAEETSSLAAVDLGAQGASLAAQAEARLAAATALEAENPSIVAISMRPAARPDDLSRAVEAAVAAAVRAPEPEAEVIEVAAAPPADLEPGDLEGLDEPDVPSSAPTIPSKASVAKQATFANAINLSKINLIGTYGTDSRRTALVRQSNGRYKKVKVGDKIDGGTIEAITETEVRYQKGGKLISLAMPRA